MQPKTIIFIGPQGSGKGTQMKAVLARLAEVATETPIMDVETGRFFRELMDQDDPTATRVKALLDAGQAVPNSITSAFVVQDFRTRYTPESHLVFDGYPRNVDQAKFLDEVLTFYDRNQVTIIYLATPEEVVRERMKARGRFDDTEEGITERLRWSMEMMLPMLEYYRARPNTDFIEIDGSQSIEDVQVEIFAALKL